MNVLIAVDGSKIAEKAFDWYIQKLHNPSNNVLIFYHTEPHMTAMQAVVSENAEILNLDTKSAEISLKYKSKLAEINCEGKFRMETSNEKAGQVIIHRAQQYNADMIVMGTRGLGVVKRTLRGSVSDHVIHNTNIPVVVCPQ